MNRLIREDVLKAKLLSEWVRDIDVVDAFLEELPGHVEPSPNCSEFSYSWIPCSEWLPDEAGTYIVTEKRYSVEDTRHTGKYCVIVEPVDFYAGKFMRAPHYEVLAWIPPAKAVSDGGGIMNVEKYIKLSDLYSIINKYEMPRDVRAQKEIEAAAIDLKNLQIKVGALLAYFDNPDELIEINERNNGWNDVSIVRADSELFTYIRDADVTDIGVANGRLRIGIREGI